MAGATNIHDDIVVNLIGELRALLRGRGVDPSPATARSKRSRANPAAGRRSRLRASRSGSDESRGAEAVEKLSASARDFDTFAQREEYEGVPSVDYVALVEPDAPVVSFRERGGAGQGSERRIEGLAGSIPLPRPGVTLRLDAVYEGVHFPKGPRLIAGEQAAAQDRRRNGLAPLFTAAGPASTQRRSPARRP